jgi:hypothetical protein
MHHQRWYFQWIFVKVLKYYLEDLGVVLIFFRIYICAIFKVLLSLADATGLCTLNFKTSWSPDTGVFVANWAAEPQHGQISVITAHFKPAEELHLF